MEGVVAAKRVEDGRVEIEFPTGTTAELREKEKSRITPLINKAFGREVVTNYLGASGPPYEHGKMCAHRVYPVVEFIIIALLIELDEEENSNINNLTFTQRNTGYEINAVTTTSSSGNETLVSRIFSRRMISGLWHCALRNGPLLVPKARGSIWEKRSSKAGQPPRW